MSINVQLHWKTKIYFSQDALVWVVHRWVQHSRSRLCWHRKKSFMYQTLYLHSKCGHMWQQRAWSCSGTPEWQVHRRLFLFWLAYCIAKDTLMERSIGLCSPSGIQEIVDFQERGQMTNEDFRSAGWRFWLHMEAVAVVVVSTKKLGESSISLRNWIKAFGILSFIHQDIYVNQTLDLGIDHTRTLVLQEGTDSSKEFHVKVLHSCTFSRKKNPKCNRHFKKFSIYHA